MPEHGRKGKNKPRTYSDPMQRRCMRLLELRRERHLGRERVKPVNGAALARALRIFNTTNRESLRRRAREITKQMRDAGAPIASSPKGYWAAETVEDFNKTAAFLRGIGLGPLATNARLKQSAARARAVGQLRFPPYHAALTGSLAIYLNPTAPGRAAGNQPGPSAPVTPEQPAQQWADSLFATA